MPFEAKKYSELVDSMRDSSTALSDFEVGSVTRTLVESFAFELSALYEKMYLAYLAGFVDTAEGAQLDRVVAILGIKRNLPDFAEGEVTFFRDAGGPDILIPLGTMVATEDSEEKPKKAYVTLEDRILAETEIAAVVKVRAFERGEEQVTPAETIIVMPRPVPGIKAVINNQPTRLSGKRRTETDEELRRRAKNALIAGGKATITSIEQALLAEPGIRDARVKEYFYRARGKVKITRSNANGLLVLPVGKVFKLSIISPPKEYEIRLLEEARFDGTDQSVEAKVELVEPVIEADVFGGAAVFNFAAGDEISKIELIQSEPIQLDPYGVIHVIVDGYDVEQDEDRRLYIIELIKKWRAAGIYVILKNVGKVRFGGIFRIDINPSLNLSPEDRRAYEREVEAAILQHLDNLRMGETLRFPRVIQDILGVDGIDTLQALRIVTTRTQKNGTVLEPKSTNFQLPDNQITIGEEDRFSLEPLASDTNGNSPLLLDPGYICVASEEKDLYFDLEFMTSGINLTDAVVTARRNSAQQYLEGSTPTISGLKTALPNLVANTFKIQAFPWAPRPVIQEDVIDVSFTERPILRNLFIYDKYLDIGGALKIKFPAFYTQAEKAAKIVQIRTKLDAYVDGLLPEELVSLTDMVAAAKTVTGVLDATADSSDFFAALNNTADPTRLDAALKTIQVKPFEKARFTHLSISSGIEVMEITLEALTIEVNDQMPNPDQDTIKTNLVNTFNAFAVSQGIDVGFSNLKAMLQSSTPALSFAITQLQVKALSNRDGRTQMRNLSALADIHVRSIELPQMQQINTSQITVVLTP
jgi:hypothetical protein